MYNGYKLNKYSMVITTREGEVKTREWRERVPYEDFRDSLFDFVFTHIGHSYVFDDFSPTTLMYRYEEGEYRMTFLTLEELKAWYLTVI